jgi:hypothetical protein
MKGLLKSEGQKRLRKRVQEVNPAGVKKTKYTLGPHSKAYACGRCLDKGVVVRFDTQKEFMTHQETVHPDKAAQRTDRARLRANV